MFRELPSPPDLARYVECVWMLDCLAAGQSVIFPDGCVEVIFAEGRSLTIGAQTVTSQASAIGLTTRAVTTGYAGPARLAGIRLTPAGGARLFGDTLSEFVNGAVDPAAIVSGFSRRFAGGLQAVVQGESPGRLFERLRGALDRTKAVDSRVERVATLLHHQRRPACIAATARGAGLSLRQLDRAFVRTFGVTPKQLARVSRFRRAFSLGMQAKRGDWAAIAAHCGYADQSHLCREFKAFTSQAPEQLRAAVARRDD